MPYSAQPRGSVLARLQPQLSPVTLVALTTAFVLFSDNNTFFAKGMTLFAGNTMQFAVLVAALYSLIFAFFILFGSRWLVKPFLAFMLILSAVTSYYMDTLGVFIDRDMVQNVATTTFTEGKHLITLGFVTQIAVWGVLPATLVFWTRLTPTRFLRAFAVNSGMFALCIALTAGLLLTNFKTYAAIGREHKDLMASTQPGAPLVGAARYVKMITKSVNTEVAPAGADAKKGDSYTAAAKPVLSILVIGETARAQDFSLDGYERDTNPELAQRDIVNFTNVHSCGTATAVSMPCMMSKFDRSHYSYDKGVSNENLVDVLSHAGFHVEWWDNNTGDKGLADRVEMRSFTHIPNAEFCPSGECTDGIYQQYLQEAVAGIKEDTVLVLHQIGSHGPTYYLRYPDEFEKFKPACRTAEFKNCTEEEIRNSYDNTILYTDHFLAGIIDLLAQQDNLDTNLFYASDHGESLGEGGLYLHGAPYMFAPEYQTKVPMLVWMSAGYKNRFGIDRGCLAAQSDDSLSHDNLYHSILGMLDIRTKERDPDLDIFSPCRVTADGGYPDRKPT